jgi:hypothetical protein
MVSSSGSPTFELEYSISWVIMGGNSGTSGVDGSGTSGTSGISGSSGTSGEAGVSGSLIMNNPAIVTTTTLSFSSGGTTQPEYFSVDTSTTGGVISLILPSSGGLSDGKMVHIKDEGGNASVNSIDIIPESGDKIDGENIYTISTDYGSVTLVKNTSGFWFILSKV